MIGRPSGWSPKTALGEDVVDLVRRLVLVHRDLLDHDLALGVDVGVRGPQHHVAHHVEGALEVLVEEARVDATSSPCRCPAFISAPMPSKISSISVELKRSVPLNSRCSRKCETPACSTRLVARAGADPEPERDRADRGQRLGHDPYARVELGELVAAARSASVPAVASSAAAVAATAATAVAAAARRRRVRGHAPPRPPPRPPRSPPPPPPPPGVAGADRRQLLGGLAGDRRGRRPGAARSGRARGRPRPRAPRSRRRG